MRAPPSRVAPPPTRHSPASRGSRGVAFPPHEDTCKEWDGIDLDGYKVNGGVICFFQSVSKGYDGR